MTIARTLALLLAFPLAGCGGARLEQTAARGGLPALPGGELDRGTYLGALAYARYCAVCHGDRADGKGANATLLSPSPPSLRPLVAEGRLDRIEAVARDGSAAHGGAGLCPPWGRSLGEERLVQVVRYLARVLAPGGGEE